MTQPISIVGIYAAAITADFDTALAWYTAFMGRPADDEPFAGMAQWRNMGTAGLQLWRDETRAGQAIMTIVVPDFAAEKARLATHGITLENEATGPFGVVATITDPEGNRITLAEPPKGFVNR